MTSQTKLTQKYWRSLGELERSAEFHQFLRREFPIAASELPEGMSRRRWLQLMGASFALASVAGCRWETEQIAPFAERPRNRIPGEVQKYATSIELAGGTRHLLVTCYDGRPVKVEGNPEHPDSQGATDLLAQASILDLYDPDRSGEVRLRKQRRTFTKDWSDFESWSREHFAKLHSSNGEGLAVLLEPTSSPSVNETLRRFCKRYSQARLYKYASISHENERTGCELAFGKSLQTLFDLDRAKVILCLDQDLLGQHPAAIRYARQFANRREPDADWMNRLYVVESQFSITGAAADHRLAIRSRDVCELLTSLETEIERQQYDNGSRGESASKRERFIRAVAQDLVKNRGESLIAVGPRQPAEIHARVHRLNVLLENSRRTVHFLETSDSPPDIGDLEALVDRMRAGAVDTLIILGGNPAYTSPADVDFAGNLANVAHAIHLSGYDDETSRLCQWHLPEAQPFECWGDVRSCDGTYGVAQPLIRPLLDGKSAIQVLAMIAGDELRDGQSIVRRSVEAIRGGAVTDQVWRKILHDGFMAGSQAQRVAPSLKPFPTERQRPADGLEIVFCPSNTLYDGRFANNGWLQETPDPITKLTWDNAAIMSPGTARKLGVKHGTLISVESHGRRIQLPAFLLPGQADDSIGVALGYGRTAAGLVGGHIDKGVVPVGFNASPIRPAADNYFITGVVVRPTQERYELATTQEHHAIDEVGLKETGRRIERLLREGTLDEYREHPDFCHHGEHTAPPESLWTEVSYEGHAWGMSVDLNKCIGCNACLLACQAENNVPVVGKEQVLRGREMHWIRADRYFSGNANDPQVAFQPVACHHCENAPCEQVCPVAATVHSDEGLNDMVYNRCVGTRYCANNCPYKVRRFNFFDYRAALEAPGRELVQLAVNPEVTVRSRGVMEKCTYCVQRIQSVKIDAKNDGRPIQDGEIVTACQQACPTRAIEFGDLNDRQSRVARAHESPRSYGMLAELNVKPRTKYLARIRNPHPLLVS